MEKKFNRIKTPLQQLIFLYIPYKTTLKLIMRNKKFQNKLEIDINQYIIYSIFKEYNIIIDNCKQDIYIMKILLNFIQKHKIINYLLKKLLLIILKIMIIKKNKLYHIFILF